MVERYQLWPNSPAREGNVTVGRGGAEIESGSMTPTDLVILLACAGVLALMIALLVSVRRLGRSLAAAQSGLRTLRDDVEALAAPSAEAPAGAEPPSRPNYVITANGDDERVAGQPPFPTGRVVAVTLGEPLHKVAAFSYGVRRALREEKRAHLAYQVRREYRRRRRATRRAARAR